MSLLLFLSLGSTPLANSFLNSPDEFSNEAFFPLDVYFCQNCTLIQLLDVINPEFLFRDYIYVTGTSDTIAAHNIQYAQTIVDLPETLPRRLTLKALRRLIYFSTSLPLLRFDHPTARPK
jgi:hypothetical protein